ncbi:F-box/LRR-repeat protein At3g03030-like [Ricinus communis]|uniref:F-box/LRR-repeat protein At3g03030-like n=1 Tax=Ricinus communis TaxID=3988 RepID=UPI00201A9E32|nr:F-box/LRR-repeat protein At3g03030-like [Ricinus communis]
MDSASKRQKYSKIGNEDRISKLPESIQCHILSFLFTNEAVTTSILCKRWRLVWTSLSVLSFHDYSYMKEEEMKSFVDFVNRVLILHANPVEEIELPLRRRGTPLLVRLPQLLFSCVSIKVLKLLIEDIPGLFEFDMLQVLLPPL